MAANASYYWIFPGYYSAERVLSQSSLQRFWEYEGLSSGSASGKETACQWRGHKRCGFDPWGGKIPWRRAWQPTLFAWRIPWTEEPCSSDSFVTPWTLVRQAPLVATGMCYSLLTLKIMTWEVFELEKQWLGLKKHLHQILPLGNMLIKNVYCHLFEWGSNVIAWCYLILLKGFVLSTLGEIVAVLYWMSTKCQAFPLLIFPGSSQWESGS